MQVNFSTYRQEAPRTWVDRKGITQSIDRHTVEVSIGTDTRRVDCYLCARGDGIRELSLFGLACRFSQGAKVWPASARYMVDRNVVVGLTPNIDKRGHFTLAGYFEDFAKKTVASQHNAVA